MKSKFKIFGGFGLIIGLFVFMIILLVVVISNPYENAQSEDLPLKFYLFWFFIAFAFLLYQILTRVNIISIKKYMLLYSNLFWQKKKVINLNKIDGYEYKVESATGGTYELITLKNNNKNLLKISSFYYSNFDEIKCLIQSKLKEIKT